MKKPKITLKQNKDEPIATEIIAQSIVDIAEGMRMVFNGRLNRRGIRVLLKDASGVSMSEIDRVLDALEGLKASYVRKT